MPGRPIASDGRAAFYDYMGMLARRKWLAAGVFCVVIGLTVVSIVRTRPVYEARATMMVGQEQNQANDLVNGYARPLFANQNYVDNCIELLRSRTIADLVAARLPDSLGLSAGTLQSMVTARPVRQTDVIELVAAGPSPRAAVAATNAYLDAYHQYDLDQSKAEVTQTRQFIEKQLAVAGPRLDSFERSLEDYKTAHGLTDLDAETKALIDQQSGVAAELQQTDAEIKANEAQLAQVQSQIEQAGEGTADKLQGIGSPLVSNLQNSLSQLEVQKANMIIGGFSDSSQRVRDLNHQIDSTRVQLKTTLQTLVAQQQFADPVGQLSDRLDQALTLNTGLTAARARRQALAAAVSHDDASLSRLPETQRVLANLTRDAETAERVNSLLSERYEEARIQEAGKMSTVRIIDYARVAARTKPDIPHTLSYGLILALALAIGSVWGSEYLDNVVRGPRDLERRGYSVLGGVPRLMSAGRRRTMRHEAVTAHLITHTDPETSGAEAFRMLRTRLAFANAEHPIHTIAVTSPGPSEGKSTVTVNLGTVLAQAGSRVLVVDADLRRPVLHTIFEHEHKPGLSDLVVGGGDPFQAIFPTPVDRLSCLPCGTIPPSPADLFALGATRDLLKRLELEYDYILIDTPPILVAADTPILGRLVDTNLLVVRAGRTAFNALEDARVALLNGGAHLSGLVVNCVKRSERSARYYYYYKYRHRYHSQATNGSRSGKEDSGRTA